MEQSKMGDRVVEGSGPRCGWRSAAVAVAFAFSLWACTGAGSSPEEVACAQVATIQPCTVGGGDVDMCVEYLTRLRTDFQGEGACRAEYDALVACYAALTACPAPGAGSLCPGESSALALCGRAP
jgi:hypothetical protein